jgi:hypothetical protein
MNSRLDLGLTPPAAAVSGPPIRDGEPAAAPQ